MSSTNGHDSSSAPGPATPMGYGHDKKGAVVGAAKNDGKARAIAKDADKAAAKPTAKRRVKTAHVGQEAPQKIAQQ